MFPLVALTNSPADVAAHQLAHAGLAERFEMILSADEVRALKPRREAYELVASRCDTALTDVRLVAAQRGHRGRARPGAPRRPSRVRARR